MLRTLIEKYYAEDELSEEQFAEIQLSREKAEKALSADSVHLFSETHWLHDWYVCGLSIDCRDEKRFCRITFTNKTRRIVLLCSEVISIYGVGEWVSASAQYPGAGTTIHSPKSWPCGWSTKGTSSVIFCLTTSATSSFNLAKSNYSNNNCTQNIRHRRSNP